MNKFRNITTLLLFIILLIGCGDNPTQNGQKKYKTPTPIPTTISTPTITPIPLPTITPINPIFKEFNVGFGGSSSFSFVGEDENKKIWVNGKDLILDENIGDNSYYQNIKEFNATAFNKLHKYLKNSKFLIYWLVDGWQESWYDIDAIQSLMDRGYIPVFQYWYFGDKLIYGMPDEKKKEAYAKDNIRVAELLSKLDGQKMLIMEPEFNKKPVLKSEETQHEFAEIISNAIDTIKAENPELLVSLSMMDTGSRGVRNRDSKCGYENCSLGDKYAWEKPQIIFNDLIDKLDFISFHQMMGQFSRDYNNPGDWDTPNPRKYSDDELGIEFLADRIANFSKFLHDKYNKPVFLPYIGIMTATWNDNNSNNKIEDSEIDYNGWVNKAEAVYKHLSELRPTLKENGLFGFAPMALFDNPRHDYGGYQYFMNNEYHLGIIGSSAKDEVSIASYGDLYFKGHILDYIFEPDFIDYLPQIPSIPLYEKQIETDLDVRYDKIESLSEPIDSDYNISKCDVSNFWDSSRVTVGGRAKGNGEDVCRVQINSSDNHSLNFLTKWPINNIHYPLTPEPAWAMFRFPIPKGHTATDIEYELN